MKTGKSFRVNDNAEIVCEWVKTRYGFRHDAKLYVNGQFVEKAKACYYNRTWESFEYESVISDLLHKTKHISVEDRDAFLKRARQGYHDEVNAQFGFISAIAKLGDVLCTDKKESNDWKSRMIKAGIGDAIQMPSDWDSLSEDEKETRLNAVIGQMATPIQ